MVSEDTFISSMGHEFIECVKHIKVKWSSGWSEDIRLFIQQIRNEGQNQVVAAKV